MTTTTKNRDYYHGIFTTPLSMMRNLLGRERRVIYVSGINTIEFFVQVAEHLTAYNEMQHTSFFFRMRDFKIIY